MVIITVRTEIDSEIALGNEVKVEGVLGEERSVTAQEMKLLGANWVRHIFKTPQRGVSTNIEPFHRLASPRFA